MAATAGSDYTHHTLSARCYLREPMCRSNLYRSEFGLLQFIVGAGTAALGWFLPVALFLDNGLAWCPWCPLTSEFGSTGLKQATQANRDEFLVLRRKKMDLIRS
jgi:hypothetical protein